MWAKILGGGVDIIPNFVKNVLSFRFKMEMRKIQRSCITYSVPSEGVAEPVSTAGTPLWKIWHERRECVGWTLSMRFVKFSAGISRENVFQEMRLG